MGTRLEELSEFIGTKILCIDDDSNITESLRRRFRRCGITLLSAHKGRHGCWLALTKQPDLIITDMKMPDGKGDYVVRRLKEDARTAAIPVIVLTGVDEPGLSERLYALGADSVLLKPTPFQELLAEIRELIAIPV